MRQIMSKIPYSAHVEIASAVQFRSWGYVTAPRGCRHLLSYEAPDNKPGTCSRQSRCICSCIKFLSCEEFALSTSARKRNGRSSLPELPADYLRPVHFPYYRHYVRRKRFVERCGGVTQEWNVQVKLKPFWALTGRTTSASPFARHTLLEFLKPVFNDANSRR